jgi:ribulose-phosphate 3-epimerase
MSVNPGFGGQKFIENTYQKIKQVKELAKAVNPNLLIEVDGGVGMANIKQLVDAGANVLVAGNAVFAADSPEEMIKSLKNC